MIQNPGNAPIDYKSKFAGNSSETTTDTDSFGYIPGLVG